MRDWLTSENEITLIMFDVILLPRCAHSEFVDGKVSTKRRHLRRLLKSNLDMSTFCAPMRVCVHELLLSGDSGYKCTYHVQHGMFAS